MGRKVIDITGETFGHLLVLTKTNKRAKGEIIWLCRCTRCGELSEVRGSRLRSGETRSCGCANKPDSLIGKVFGLLTMLSRVSNNYKGNSRWLCACACGRETEVLGRSLRTGDTNSCGHCLKIRPEDHIGDKFGNLTVEEIMPDKDLNGATCVRCLCSCGNSIILRWSSVTNGNSRSCGCKKGNRKHLLSGTPVYRTVLSLCRREMEKNLDPEWSPTHEAAIRSFFDSCVVCGSKHKLATDHVLPLSKGYGLVPGNAVRLCVHCNSVKLARDLDDLPTGWREKITEAADKFFVAWSGGF